MSLTLCLMAACLPQTMCWLFGAHREGVVLAESPVLEEETGAIQGTIGQPIPLAAEARATQQRRQPMPTDEGIETSPLAQVSVPPPKKS